MTVKFTTIPSKRLAEQVTASSTSLRLNNILSWDGETDLTPSDVGTSVYAVLRNSSNTRIEIMELDGANIDDTEIPILRRGLQFDGNLTTEVPANKLDWNKTETIVELGSDAPQLFQYLKEYIDGVAIAGSPNASLTAKGIVEMATTAEIDSDGSSGPTGANIAVRPDQLAASKYGTRLPSSNEKDAMTASTSPTTANPFVTVSALFTNIVNFGDGSDGDVTISSPTTLSSDMYYNNLTVNDVLTTAGYRIFVKETLSGSGTIRFNGANGSNGSALTGGAGGAAVSGYFATIAGGTGGNGASGSDGTAGTAGGVTANALVSTAGAAGGAAQSGGSPTNVGGAAGAGSTVTAYRDQFGTLRHLVFSGLDITATGATIKATAPAAGGGGGGGAGKASHGGGGGGGGGASGGIVAIFAKTWAGTFTIQATGGNGGNGANASGSADSSGGSGGGGGNGGYIYVVYQTKTWSGSHTVTGGTGGTGGTGTTGAAGVSGSNGAVGLSKEININSML